MNTSKGTANAEVSGEKPEVIGGGLEFEKLTEAIIGCAITVQRALGPGLLESTYQACLAYELRQAGLKAQTEIHIDLCYEELQIENAFRVDILVEDSIVLELKTVDRLTDAHKAQVFTYLRFSGRPLGILLNFWAWPLKDGGIKRVLNPRSNFHDTRPSPHLPHASAHLRDSGSSTESRIQG